MRNAEIAESFADDISLHCDFTLSSLLRTAAVNQDVDDEVTVVAFVVHLEKLFRGASSDSP